MNSRYVWIFGVLCVWTLLLSIWFIYSHPLGSDDHLEDAEIRSLKVQLSDLQNQIDVLKQNIPVDTQGGQHKVPAIEYTKWGRQFFDTKRTETPKTISKSTQLRTTITNTLPSNPQKSPSF